MRLLGVGVRVALVVMVLGVALPGSAGARVGLGSERLVAVSAPSGYVIKQASFSAPQSSLDSSGSVSCPTGTATWGGGALFTYFLYTASINTTYWNGATPGAWDARVNNTDPIAATFAVRAVCAKKPAGYQEVYTRVDDPGGNATGTATCPSSTVLLSGGVSSFADSAYVYLTRAWPVSSRAFRATQENDTSGDQPFYVYALCATKPPGYAQTKASVSVGYHTDGTPAAKCPAKTAVIGGGFTMSILGWLSVNGSFPARNSMGAYWDVSAYNDTGPPTNITLSAYAICAA